VPRSPGHLVVQAIDAIHSFPDRPYTVSALADLAGLSVRSLRQEFHLRVGMTPMAYLRQIRLARAHADLMAGDPALTSVATVARRWGFPRPGVFAACYLARYHTTPGRTLLGATAGDG
jgi:transcriptional regulator GlxA family with amidase domain